MEEIWSGKEETWRLRIKLTLILLALLDIQENKGLYKTIDLHKVKTENWM